MKHIENYEDFLLHFECSKCITCKVKRKAEGQAGICVLYGVPDQYPDFLFHAEKREVLSTAFLLLYPEPWRELDGVTRLQWTLPLEFGLAMQMLCGLMISLAPMAASLASGNRLQGSIGWGISVMEGKADESQETPGDTETEQAQPSDLEQKDEQVDLAGMFYSMGKLIRLGFEELIGESMRNWSFLYSRLPGRDISFPRNMFSCL